MEEQNILPADYVGQRIADLRTAKKMSKEALAKKVGISPSMQGRIERGETKSIKDEQLKNYAEALDVSTDFLLGTTDFPGKKNYEIGELGLSIKAAEVLYTRSVDVEVVNRLLEDKGFPELTDFIQAYFQQELAQGVRARNEILRHSGSLVRKRMHDKDTRDLQRDINASTIDPFEIDINRIRDRFMGILTRIRKDIYGKIPTSDAANKETINIMFQGLDQDDGKSTPAQLKKNNGPEYMAKQTISAVTQEQHIKLTGAYYKKALKHMTDFWRILGQATGHLK